MNQKIIFKQWNPFIPLEFINEDEFESFAPPQNRSLDGKQYLQIEKKDDQTLISIMEENKLINQITLPGSIQDTNLIEFSSEYLILIRVQGDPQIEVYIHNFYSNTGKSFVFENDYFVTCLYSIQVSHLLFQTEQILYLYRIDSQIQLINKVECSDFRILQQQNNIGFLLQMVDRISILSISKLKPLFQYKYTCYQDNFVVDFIKGLFFTHKKYFKNYIIVGQIRNRKIIRRIPNKNHFVEFQCQYKNYLFSYCSINQSLFVLDITLGKWIGYLECYYYPHFYKMQVKDGYLIIQAVNGEHYRCKLRNN